MRTKHLQGVKVGDLLFILTRDGKISECNNRVVKVGRKYIVTQGGEQWCIETGGFVLMPGFFGPGRAFKSADQCVAYAEKRKAWQRLRAICGQVEAPSHLTTAQIGEITGAILGKETP